MLMNLSQKAAARLGLLQSSELKAPLVGSGKQPFSPMMMDAALLPRMAQVAEAEVTAEAKMADEKTSFMIAFCFVCWLVVVG